MVILYFRMNIPKISTNQKILIISVSLLIILVLWFLVWPAFRTVEIDEAIPVVEGSIPATAITAPTSRFIPPTFATDLEVNDTLPSSPEVEKPLFGIVVPPLEIVSAPSIDNEKVKEVEMEMKEMLRSGKEVTTITTPQYNKALVEGTFGHPARGTAQIIRAGEKTFVRFEDFSTIDGPRLNVYLAKTLEDIDNGEYYDLGLRKATKGNFNYEIPADVNIDEYKYIVHWCVPFGVLFNWAKIQ